jgi:hypothetical protein
MKLKLDSNFCDLLGAFRACSVKYLIIGGWAVSIHAQPRATQDMDIFVSPDRDNIEALYEALVRFGAPPCQVDVLPGIPGVEFEACWPNRLEVLVEEGSALSANVISAKDLIAAKIASGREQDLATHRPLEGLSNKNLRSEVFFELTERLGQSGGALRSEHKL